MSGTERYSIVTHPLIHPGVPLNYLWSLPVSKTILNVQWYGSQFSEPPQAVLEPTLTYKTKQKSVKTSKASTSRTVSPECRRPPSIVHYRPFNTLISFGE